jgi:hypothetical protein
MEVINDTPFEVEALPFSNGPNGKPVLTVIVKGTFDIRPNEVVEVAAEQIPIAFGDELYDEKQGGSVKFESDVAPFKPRADIVLVGRAHVPRGGSALALDVSLRVGQVKKTIRVFGDRRWKFSGPLMSEHPTKPEPFTTMEITYERAFGGIDKEGGRFCAENLVGRGFFAKKSKKVIGGALLPNIEDPQKLIKAWKDHPMPVGFGFYGRAWKPRSGYLGTYDDKWREERSPDPPEDFKFDYHNAAHPDLQVNGYLKGNEEVELINLTSDGSIRFKLPGVGATCTVIKTSLEGKEMDEESSEDQQMGDELEEELDEDFDEFEDEYEELEEAEESPLIAEEVNLNLDTLCLIPDERRLVLIWRGLCPIKDLTALEVKTIEIS